MRTFRARSACTAQLISSWPTSLRPMRSQRANKVRSTRLSISCHSKILTKFPRWALSATRLGILAIESSNVTFNLDIATLWAIVSWSTRCCWCSGRKSLATYWTSRAFLNINILWRAIESRGAFYAFCNNWSPCSVSISSSWACILFTTFTVVVSWTNSFLSSVRSSRA